MWCQGLSRIILDKIKNTSSMSKTRFLVSTIPQQKDERKTQSTIDAAEVEMFSKLTKEWWDLNGPFRTLHKMNMIRVPFVRDGLVQCDIAERDLLPLKDKKILDVGCGGGLLSEALARLGAEVTGIDASKELIQVAHEHANVDPKIANNKPTYYNTPIEDHISTYSNHYDGVVASEVVEHVNNQELFIKSCVQAAKPGGRIFFTTPNRTPLARFLVICVGENVINLLPKGTHQYEKFITPTELTFILERSDCHVEIIYGYTFNPITENWSFSSSQQLGYVMQALKLH